MSKLWEKSNSNKIDKLIERFAVGEDYILDLKLIKMDILASVAHCSMLEHVGIIKQDELRQIKRELIKLLGEKIELSIADEDIHSKIENILTERLGSIGKKIHTGRSRNDQVLVDLRLYSKEALLSLENRVLNLGSIFLDFAKKYEFLAMPGYTHMQLGMPSSVGMWASAFVEAFLDELTLLDYAYYANDTCPLGSGAGYGVSIFLDRAMTQKLLGFRRLQNNALYCANSRGKIEGNTISAITSLALVLNKIASDMLLFTTREFDFFSAEDEITTGSSIMPQKKNLDVLELIRAKLSTLMGFEFAIKSVISNLVSGYNRDFQETKKYLLSAFDTINDCVDIMAFVMQKITPKENKLTKANLKEIYATDYAYKLVIEKGMPFREAYIYAGNNIDKIKTEDAKDIIKKRKTIGSTGNLKLSDYTKKIQEKTKALAQEKTLFENTLKNLLD